MRDGVQEREASIPTTLESVWASNAFPSWKVCCYEKEISSYKQYLIQVFG